MSTTTSWHAGPPRAATGPPRCATPPPVSPSPVGTPVASLAPTKTRAAACHSGRARPSPDSELPRLAPTVAAEAARRSRLPPSNQRNRARVTIDPSTALPGETPASLAGIVLNPRRPAAPGATLQKKTSFRGSFCKVVTPIVK
jgi:hypothetical protein